MYLKLKRWLTAINWLTNSSTATDKSGQFSQLPNYNDLAFQLAVANDISETLPPILALLQTQLNDLLPKQHAVNLLVLLCHPATSESWLYHAHETALPSQLPQMLHRQFTIKHTKENELLAIDNLALNLIPVRLFNHDQHQVWLLYMCTDAVPSQQLLRWKTASLENTLSKGIKAWYQTESKINAALENERAIYAAELHDSLAQILGYLKIKSAKLDKLCQKPPHQELKTITEDLATYTQCAYHQIRELIISSRLTVQSDNLSQAVTNSVHEFEQQSAIVFELDNRLQSANLPPKASMQILYIIRESLSNIVRHSHASHAHIKMFINDNNALQIDIEDNGIGIDAMAARHDSFGLKIMHERTERIGGKLTITNSINHGTRVKFTLDIGV